MYHKLRVRFPWASCSYEEVAVDDINIDFVKAGEPGKSLVYDMDGVLCFEVDMPYDELVARLNGEDVPEKPQPKIVERWIVSTKSGYSDCFRTLEAARHAADWLDQNGSRGLTLTHLTGEEQPWRK